MKYGGVQNGISKGEKREEFELLYNVHYEEETFSYLHKSGIEKIIRALTFMKYKIQKEFRIYVQAI